MNKFLRLSKDLVTSLKEKPWPSEEPTVIQFPINDICNARCQMCNIWQQKLDTQISIENLKIALKDSLFKSVVNVGINGGEPTLRKDTPIIISLLFENLPKLKKISLITNALSSKRVINSIDEMAETVSKYGGKLDVMLSLDGIGEIHDKVRGRAGNFDNLKKVLSHVKSHKNVSNVQLACTVIKENVLGVHDVLDFAIEENVYVKFRLGIPHQRLYTEQLTTPFSLSYEDKFYFASFLNSLNEYYEISPSQSFFYKSLIGQILEQKERSAGCNWQHRGITITSRGELTYCAVEGKNLGKIHENSSSELYYNNKEHLNNIIKNKCGDCTHDYGGIPQGTEFLLQCLDAGFKKIGISLKNIKKGQQFERSAKLAHNIKTLYKLVSIEIRQRSKRKITKRRINTKNPKIMICGWYGTETLGDKAILASIIDLLSINFEKPIFHIATLDKNISTYTNYQIFNDISIELLTLNESKKESKNMDMLIFGGGPLMSVNAIIEIYDLFRIAAKNGVLNIIAGCGIGPVKNSLFEAAIKSIISHSDYRIFRDSTATRYTISNKINKANDFESEDPSHYWIRKTIAKEKNTIYKDSTINSLRGEKYIVLALRSWPHIQYNGCSANEAEDIVNEAEDAIIFSLEKISEKYPELKIVPFPMCTNHHGGDDRWYLKNLLKKADVKPALKSRIDEQFLYAEVNPLKACEVFSKASIVLGMRFHSIIFAYECGVPTIAIDYSEKNGKIFCFSEKHGIPRIRYQELDERNLLEKLNEAVEKPIADTPKQDLEFDKAMNSIFSSEITRIENHH